MSRNRRRGSSTLSRLKSANSKMRGLAQSQIDGLGSGHFDVSNRLYDLARWIAETGSRRRR